MYVYLVKNKARLFVLLLVVVGIAAILFTGYAMAIASTPYWNTEQGVTVSAGTSYNQSNLPANLLSERPCSNDSYSNKTGTQQTVCTVHTSGYKLTHDAKMVTLGGTVLNPVINKLNQSSKLIPLDGSSSMLEIQGKQSSARLRIIKNAFSKAITDYQKTPTTVYITSTDQYNLIDDANNTYLFSDYYLNTSADNTWVVSQNGNGIYKYNLVTNTIQYLRTGYYSKNGYSPELMLAISESGRYVAVYTGRENKLEIIDTNTCTNSTAKRGQDAGCSSRNITSDITNSISNLYLQNQFRYLQFENENTISFYAYKDWVNNQHFTLQKVYATSEGSAQKRALDYLAMGDSYASGEGVYNYKDGTDIYGTNMCHLAMLSYPYIIANKGAAGDTESVACSGAKVKDIFDIGNKDYIDDKPQAKGFLDKSFSNYIYTNFIVGNRRQHDFLTYYKPGLITLSIGGNDIGFSKIVSTCVSGTIDCYSSTQQRKQLVSIIQNTYQDLVTTYTEVKSSSPQTKLYVIGYPQIAKENGNCAKNVALSNKEIAFSNKLISYLNSVIKKASLEAGVVYIDTEDAFSGRRLCEVDSNLAAANGLTAGNTSGLPKEIAYIIGNGGPLAQESYHPNIIGHVMYAKVIQEKTQSFSINMPDPILQNVRAASPELDAFLQDTIDDFDYSDQSQYLYDDSFAEDVLWQGKDTSIIASTQQYGTTPNTNFSLVMYSEPRNVGSAISDDDGNISATIHIPDDIPAGFHTLHLVGKTINGEDIDIQKIVYVAASEADIDGDGVPNDQELCLIGEPSNTDVDQDGIDDACDGFIDLPPTPTQPAEKELIQSESAPLSQFISNEPPTSLSVATSTIPFNPVNSAPVQNTPTANTATTQDTPQQTNPTPTRSQNANTQVAGVSSAVESKPLSERTATSWWVYLMVATAVFITSVTFYRIIAAKNRV